VPYRPKEVEKAESTRLLGNARTRPEQGDHVYGEHGRCHWGGGLALGTCALGRGEAESLHGAALGPGVPAFVLPEFGVATETWVERRESRPCGGHVCRSGHV
jgi:hypothetical protein